MHDEQLRQEYRRRMMRTYVVIGISIAIGLFVVPLLRGEAYRPLAIFITLLVTIPLAIGTILLTRRLGGGYSLEAYAEQRRQQGESRWAWYRRVYGAPPRHRPIYRLFIVLGILSILLSPLVFFTTRLLSLGNLALGFAMLLLGGAEFLPLKWQRGTIAARIAGLVVMMVAIVLLWLSILRR